MPSSPSDLAIVGAGPAGLAAAVTAARLGLRVTLLDAGERPGGQFYRHPAPGLGALRPQALHHDWRAFTAREAALRAHVASGRIAHHPFHHVWTVVPDGADGWTLHAVAGPEEHAATYGARAVLLATGAYERQLPFPGWTLPGVIGAGGAQAMLKGGLVLPGRRVVVAGSGPLLLAVAGSLAAAGATVPAVAEAASYTAYAPQARALLRNPAKLAEGAVYGGALARHGIRLLTRHAVTEAHGRGRVEAVTVARLDRDWRPLPGTARRIPCDALAVGHGLVPQLELATSLGCATLQAPDGTVALDLDAAQRTSVPGIWSAGETGGIGGAQLALTEGRSPRTRSRGCRSRPPSLGPGPGCGPSPGRWPPPTVRARGGRTGCPTRPPSAAARRSRRAGSARPSPSSARGTPVPSNCSPGPEWAGARAGCAVRPSPRWPGRTPRPTGVRCPAPFRCAIWPRCPRRPAPNFPLRPLIGHPRPLWPPHTH